MGKGTAVKKGPGGKRPGAGRPWMRPPFRRGSRVGFKFTVHGEVVAPLALRRVVGVVTFTPSGKTVIETDIGNLEIEIVEVKNASA